MKNKKGLSFQTKFKDIWLPKKGLWLKKCLLGMASMSIEAYKIKVDSKEINEGLTSFPNLESTKIHLKTNQVTSRYHTHDIQ